jgi:hypothetical protein
MALFQEKTLFHDLTILPTPAHTIITTSLIHLVEDPWIETTTKVTVLPTIFHTNHQRDNPSLSIPTFK